MAFPFPLPLPLGPARLPPKAFSASVIASSRGTNCSTSQLLFEDVVAFESASPLRAAPREPQASKRKIWDSCGVIYHVHLRALFWHVLPFYEHKMCLSSTHTTHVYTMRTYYVYTVCTHTHVKPSTTTTYTVYTPRFSSKICSMLLAFHMSVGVRKIQQLGHRKFMIQALHQAFISWCAYTKTCCRKSENLQEKHFLNNEQNKLITRYRSRFGRIKKEDAGIARLGNGGRSISPNSHLEWVSEIHKVQSCLLNVSKRQSISTIKCIPTILQPKHPHRLSGGSLCKVPANHASK